MLMRSAKLHEHTELESINAERKGLLVLSKKPCPIPAINSSLDPITCFFCNLIVDGDGVKEI